MLVKGSDRRFSLAGFSIQELVQEDASGGEGSIDILDNCS